ncbi:hypothetical protein JQC92_18645 [Shewanella sp. 202IG2-18]|uniref:ATP-binding protein n=1 Tax=Parashewanella hymeniacidonis TaxID=2807618 RepID=UPI00195F8D87|nr:hypothetical protein [Parashewanella hymeniacidonis]MBM7074027.1 hypothetical protein [Parashewanella hymeniacidonis]
MSVADPALAIHYQSYSASSEQIDDDYFGGSRNRSASTGEEVPTPEFELPLHTKARPSIVADKPSNVPVMSAEIPNIVITGVGDVDTPVNRASGFQAGRLSVYNPLQVPLQNTRNEVVTDIQESERKATEKALEALDKAKEADLKMAKKTFFMKLAKTCLAIAAAAVAIGFAVPTGGVSIAAAAVIGVAAVLSTADTISAAVDWGLKVKGKDGLPFEADGLGNIAYALFRFFDVSEEKAEKYAGWSSTGIKLVLTLGLLWAGSVTPKSKVKPSDIQKNGEKILKLAGDKLTKYADAINMTKEKLQKLEQEARLKDEMASEISEYSDDLKDIDDLLDDREDDAREALRAKRENIKQQHSVLFEELKQSRKQLEQLREALSKVKKSDMESLVELEQLMELNNSSELLLMSESDKSATRYSEVVFAAEQVPLPSELDFTAEVAIELKNAQQATEDARKAYKEAQLKLKTNQVYLKAFGCFCAGVSLGGAIMSTVLTGPVAAPLIFFSLGALVTSVFDFEAAIVDERRLKNDEDLLPVKDNGIANAIHYLLVKKAKVSDPKALKAAKAMAGIIQIFFTLGGKWPEADQQLEIQKKAKEGEKYLKPIEDAIKEKLTDKSEVDETKAELDIKKVKAALAAEQLRRLQLVVMDHKEIMAQIKYAEQLENKMMLLERKRLRLEQKEKEQMITDIQNELVKLSAINTDLFNEIQENLDGETRGEIEALLENIKRATDESDKPVTQPPSSPVVLNHITV